jgi:hypothetical protein
MVEVALRCPICAKPATVQLPVRRSADEFCASCDFPLFWSPELVGRDSGGNVSASPCDACAHVNPADSAFCNHCGARI